MAHGIQHFQAAQFFELPSSSTRDTPELRNKKWQIFPLEVVLLYIHRIARWINLPFFQFIQNNVEGSPFVIKSNIHQVMTFILVLLYAVTFFQDRTYPTEGAASGGTAGYG